MKKRIFMFCAVVAFVCHPVDASIEYAGVPTMSAQEYELIVESLAGEQYKINVEQGMSWAQILERINTQNNSRFRKIFTGQKMMDLTEKITNDMLKDPEKERLYVTR